MGKRAPGRPSIRGNPIIKQAYWVWYEMLRRCGDQRNAQFKDYGGRGITVCDEWRVGFWAFYDCMWPRPPGAILDRRDNDAGYSPSNCRWATRQESNANRRYCIMVNGVTLKEYMRDNGQIDRYRMVAKRIRRGMDVARALSIPSRDLLR